MVEITMSTIEGVHQLVVTGDVDASSSIHLDNAIRAAINEGHKKIMVDGSALNYISSAGLGVFMSYLEDFSSQGIRFVVFGLQEKVYHVFKLIGLENLLKIVGTKEEAEAYLNDSQA